MSDQELERAVSEFTGAFEVVFGRDWDYSRDIFGQEMRHFIRPDATFIEPGLELDRTDWGARAALLRSYRRLLAVMAERGAAPVLPEPDAYFCYRWPEPDLSPTAGEGAA